MYLVKGQFRDDQGPRAVVGLVIAETSPSRNVLKGLGFPSHCSVEQIHCSTSAPNKSGILYHFNAAPGPSRRVTEVAFCTSSGRPTCQTSHEFDLRKVLPAIDDATFSKHFGAFETQHSSPLRHGSAHAHHTNKTAKPMKR